jgi:alkaline phosphatase D
LWFPITAWKTLLGIGSIWITFADLSAFPTEGMLLCSSGESDAENGYADLKGASNKFVVCRRGDAPNSLHYDENERDGDPVLVASGPYAILAHAANLADTVPKNKGGHGYDPQQSKPCAQFSTPSAPTYDRTRPSLV